MVLNNILLLTTQNRLFIAQASSSFERFDMHTFTYTTPTFIIEALRILTQVQLLLIYLQWINILYSAILLLLG